MHSLLDREGDSALERVRSSAWSMAALPPSAQTIGVTTLRITPPLPPQPLIHASRDQGVTAVVDFGVAMEWVQVVVVVRGVRMRIVLDVSVCHVSATTPVGNI